MFFESQLLTTYVLNKTPFKRVLILSNVYFDSLAKYELDWSYNRNPLFEYFTYNSYINVHFYMNIPKTNSFAKHVKKGSNMLRQKRNKHSFLNPVLGAVRRFFIIKSLSDENRKCDLALRWRLDM